MNRQQILSLVRDLLKIVGVGLASKGAVSADAWDVWTTVIVEVVGCGLIVGPIIWSQFTHTQSNAVAVVDAIAKEPMSAVKGVILEPTAAGRELAASIPGSTAVVAGTHEAAAIATR
jgi:hypothetical protein